MKSVFKVSAVLPVILAALVGGTVLILRNSQPANQFVFLPDGTMVRYLGVRVGTNHLSGSKSWKVVNRLPGPISRPLLQLWGGPPFPNSFNTNQTNLVVWLEHLGALPRGPVSRVALLRVLGGRLSGAEQHVSLWRAPGQSNSVPSKSGNENPLTVANRSPSKNSHRFAMNSSGDSPVTPNRLRDNS